MPQFDYYAEYYDALYADKDYLEECDFIEKCFELYSESKVQSIVDWGCGTGNHAHRLSERGYEVIGVDRSSEMIRTAENKKCGQKIGPTYITESIADARLPILPDAAISMFAVMGYQKDNSELLKTLSNIRLHLRSGSIFLFDCWYGPAVLYQKPSDRVREIHDGQKRILRFVNSRISPHDQLVDVRIRLICSQGNTIYGEVEELHPMRFFFDQEILLLLQFCGFELLRICPAFDLSSSASETSWNIVVIARAI